MHFTDLPVPTTVFDWRLLVRGTGPWDGLVAQQQNYGAKTELHLSSNTLAHVASQFLLSDDKTGTVAQIFGVPLLRDEEVPDGILRVYGMQPLTVSAVYGKSGDSSIVSSKFWSRLEASERDVLDRAIQNIQEHRRRYYGRAVLAGSWVDESEESEEGAGVADSDGRLDLSGITVRSWPAKYKGKCGVCGDSYDVGERIARIFTGDEPEQKAWSKYAHEECI